MQAWNDQRLEYAQRIIPPQLGISRIVSETRHLIEDGCSSVTGDPSDVRGCFPGTKELARFIQACLFGGTERSFIVREGNKEKAEKERVDYGCMPLYKRDFSKHVRAQVPVETLMQMYAECELWRAEADGEPYLFLIDGTEGQGFLAQRDHGPDGPYRRIQEPKGRDDAGEEVMALVSRYADDVGQQSAVAFYLDLCRLAPHRSVTGIDPALVPLGSGYMFDPRTKKGRPMTDDDAFVGSLTWLTWSFNDDGTVAPIPKPLFCEDGEVVYDEAEAAAHGGVAFDPERFLAEVQPTEDGQNAIWDVTQAVATPRMPRAKGALFVGESRAGKGLILSLLRHGYGDEAQQARTTTTMNMTQFSDRTFNVAARGKLLVYSDEESTGGYIKDCAPYKAFVEHKPFGTRDVFGKKISVTGVGFFLQCTNDFTGSSDKGASMFGRLYIIPFRVSHLGREDRRFETWMVDPRTVNWWFYHALVELPFQPELRENDLTLAAKGEYQLAIDPVRQFLDEEIRPKVGAFTSFSQLYEMYLMWNKHVNSSGRALSKKRFIASLDELVKSCPDEFVCPREEDKNGTPSGFVRLTASKVFSSAQAMDYLHDPMVYCTSRVGYKDVVTWEPQALDAWCDFDAVKKMGQVRGWLVRADAWRDYKNGGNPVQKAFATMLKKNEAREEAHQAQKAGRARAKVAKDKATEAKERAANAKRFDTDEYYAWYLDAVELANEEFGGYTLEGDEADECRHEPLTREEWTAHFCPYYLTNAGSVTGFDGFYSFSHRMPVDCDAAYEHYRSCAETCIERDGAYVIGGDVDGPGSPGTVFTRVLDRATWATFGAAVERVRRVKTDDGRSMWLLGPAQSGSFDENPGRDTTFDAYRRYGVLAEKALAEVGGYAVRSKQDAAPTVLREVVSKFLWEKLSCPSIHVRDVDVDGQTPPCLEPARLPVDWGFMSHRLGYLDRVMACVNVVPEFPAESEPEDDDASEAASSPREADAGDDAYDRFREVAQAALDEAGGYVVLDGGPEGATLCREVVGRDEWAAYGRPTKRADEPAKLDDGTAWPLIE